MKFTANIDLLKSSVQRIQRVVEKRNTIPILSNIMLDATGDKLLLRATDLDIEITESVPVNVATSGSTTVPAHIFYDILRKLPANAEIAFEIIDGQQATIKAGRSRFNLNVLPTSDYPELSMVEPTTTFMIGATKLKKLFATASPAMSTEEVRYYLNGLYLHQFSIGNRIVIRAVATNGHRLSLAQMDAPAGAEQMQPVIVPRKTVTEIVKLVDGVDGEVKIELSNTKIRITIGDVTLTSKLIDGTFPDYVRVLPQGNDKILKVDRSEFAGAVDRVSTISSERGRAVKLALSIGNMELSVDNPDKGSAAETMSSDYSSDAIEIGFQSSYLSDIINSIDTEVVEVSLADPNSPTLFRSVGDEDSLHVLMPMRV